MNETVEIQLTDLFDWLQAHGCRLHHAYLNDGENAALVGEFIPVPAAPPAIVGFAGSREWREQEQVQRVVDAVLKAGRHVAVGCAPGADQAVIHAVLEDGQAQRLAVYAAFGPEGEGSLNGSATDAVRQAFDAGAHVHWWAGASRWISPYAKARLPLTQRQTNRSLALVQSVAGSKQQGAGLVAFADAPPSRLPESGSWVTIAAAAARKGMPVVVFTSGFSEERLPMLPGEGGWVRAGDDGVWMDGWRWVSG